MKQREGFSVGAILLAAGQAKRMGETAQHKLLAEFDGVPLVQRSAIVLLASNATPVVAVTGHRQRDIEAALTGINIATLFNPSYLTNMASSVACGVSHPQIAACDGVLIMLADMPGIVTDHSDSVIRAFAKSGGEAIVRASFHDKPGHPVLFPRALYNRLIRLSGDVGARELIAGSKLPIIMIDIGPAALLDVDTPTAIVENGGVLRG
ncbi:MULTISPECIES: nucleotidyltransferase family protein [unclassified Rhizobium]|uniref:nucleotidyltransferase family protein n=1 Tax=unclassified Rhizobium TaxID=2613769 RepID=UPI000DD74F7A|nr:MULTISPECIES: nucleotidyltransferase family protein [unclassified Rhizobium]MBB3387193.1 molybdenum cofactor cytidylyltransferase [Rhizobium sp. BK098]MBB3618906.1 molybdenum cofactor cytidylyltransferase [Rhizobium sp. BK609]MBB3684553.1 molybdenum cofactor cytidylyltransferase [Rhizobium sp. BK612]